MKTNVNPEQIFFYPIITQIMDSLCSSFNSTILLLIKNKALRGSREAKASLVTPLTPSAILSDVVILPWLSYV